MSQTQDSIMAAVTAEGKSSIAELIDPKVEIKIDKSIDTGKVCTTQFTATIIFNIFNIASGKIFMDAIKSKAEKIADKYKKVKHFKDVYHHDEFYDSSTFADEFRTSAIQLIREYFQGINERINYYCFGNNESSENCISLLIEDQSMDIELYRPNSGGLVGFITDHIISVIFAIFRSIARRTENKFKTYRCLVGEAKEEDFIISWDIVCNSFFTSILSEDRGDATGLILISEVIEKTKEWLLAIARTKTKPLEMILNGKKVFMHRFINPGFFHYRISGVEYKAGKIVPIIESGAIEVVEQKKNQASSNSVYDEHSKESKLIEEKLEKLLDKYRKMKVSDPEAKDFFGVTFPYLLEKIKDDFTELYMETVYPSMDLPSLKTMIGCIIERSMLGYQAWMNNYKYLHLGVTSNFLGPIKLGTEKEDKREIPFEIVFPVMNPSIRRSIYDSKRIFACFLTPEILELLPLFKNQRFSCPIDKGLQNGFYHWGTSTFRVPITCLVDCYNSSINQANFININAAPNGICVWIYCKNDDAVKELQANNGNVSIDGKKFMLLIYNPNFDIKTTRYNKVRGCWFLLALDKNNKLKFHVLTRKVFEKVFEMDSINAIVTFKYYDATSNSTYIVNYTYVTIPLPPLMIYEGEDSNGIDFQLMNEYPRVLEYFKKHPEATNASFLRELESMNPSLENGFGTNLAHCLLDSQCSNIFHRSESR